jgi:hypothetical protein
MSDDSDFDDELSFQDDESDFMDSDHSFALSPAPKSKAKAKVCLPYHDSSDFFLCPPLAFRSLGFLGRLVC